MPFQIEDPAEKGAGPVKASKNISKPTTRTIIRFQDCDPFGHLNNARYLDYFINAREEHLAENYDLDIYERQKILKENWVVAQHQIAYISPVIFREEVIVSTCLLHFTHNSLLMEGLMLDQEGLALKAVLWTRFKYFNFAKYSVVNHPNDTTELFQNITVTDRNIDRKDFNHRVRQLRGLYSNSLDKGPF